MSSKSKIVSGLAMGLLVFAATSVHAGGLTETLVEFSNYHPSEPQCNMLADLTSVAPITKVVNGVTVRRLYVSTDKGCIAELDATTLTPIRSKWHNLGSIHQIATNSGFLYAHGTCTDAVDCIRKFNPFGNGGITTPVASKNIAGGKGSPEGFLFIGNYVYVQNGGGEFSGTSYPGRVTKLNKSDLAVVRTWTVPTTPENGPKFETHGMTTDDTYIYVLVVPQRDVKSDRYYKLDQNLNVVNSMTFSGKGTLGGNVALKLGNGWRIFSTAAGAKSNSPGLLKINPNLFVEGSQANSCNTHWLVTDGSYIYRVGKKHASTGTPPCSTDSSLGGGAGYIEVVDPANMALLATKKNSRNWPYLHYGVWQDGYLWIAFESQPPDDLPGRIGRYTRFVR